MEKAVAKLRSTPEPGRFYLLSNIVEDIKNQNGIGASEKKIIQECFVNIDTVASTTVLVQHIVGLVKLERITCDIAYGLLLGGLSAHTKDSIDPCIHSVSHAIMDVFEMDKVPTYRKNQHPLVKAWMLERRSGATFVSRIELLLLGTDQEDIDASARNAYFKSVEPFLMEAVCGAHGGGASIDLGSSIRNSLVRLGCSVDMDIHIIVRFFVDVMRGCDSSSLLELEACMMDVIDVIFCPALKVEGIDDGCIEEILDVFFYYFLRSLEQGFPVSKFVGAISCFLPTYASFCMKMTIPLSLQGVRSGESEDAKSCFDLIALILKSSRAYEDGIKDEFRDAASLSILECACLRARFYCQGNHINESIQYCLKEIERLLRACEDDLIQGWINPYLNFEWCIPLDVFSWIQAVSISCMRVDSPAVNAHVSTDLLEVQILCLLRHPSISVRLQTLQLVRKMPQVSDSFSFYAIPVLLHRIQEWTQTSGKSSRIDDALVLKELLFALAALSKNHATIPFIVRTLQGLVDPTAPTEIQGIAYRILCNLWLESARGYASLRLALLGCDMEDSVEVRSKKHTWIDEDIRLDKLAAAVSLIDICSKDPGKGKDFVHMIHACICSKFPVLASAGLECIRLLCSSEILDFPKAWKVVSKIHPNLPSDTKVASAWVDLISCALYENPDIHEQMVRDVMELSWQAASHESELVRMKGYKLLEETDWDIAETLDCLRPPIKYAQLLSSEGDTQIALMAYEEMMTKVLALEFLDRRKQYIHLSGTISNKMKQNHNARFHKLSQGIPKVLLKEVKCGNNVLPNSGDGSKVFVILYLWKPLERRASQGPQLYRQIAKELLSNDPFPCFDLLVDLENIVVLCEGWRAFFHRWISSFHSDVAAEPRDYHKRVENILEIWTEIEGSIFDSSDAIVNPNIPSAIVALALQFSDAQPFMAGNCFELIFKIARDKLQQPSIRNLSIVLMGMILDQVKIHVGDSTVSEAISYFVESDDLCLKHRFIALKLCFQHRLRNGLLQRGFDLIMKSSGGDYPACVFKPNAKDLSVQNIALGALGCGIYHLPTESMSPIAVLQGVQSLLKDLQSEKLLQELIPGSCELLFYATSKAYENSEIEDVDISKGLDALCCLLESETMGSYIGHVVLAIARILTGALKHGYGSNKNWNIDICVSIIREHLGNVTKHANVRENAGQICKGLNLCLEYQMCNEKSQDESCTEENTAENELELICNLDSSSAVRMGCIPHISKICRKAIDFKENSESYSMESFTSSAIGYLSEVLISQAWPNLQGNQTTISRQKILTLLSCLGQSPRLPRKDWTACLRRYIRLYNDDKSIHVAVVKFACDRAKNGAGDNLREFVTKDIFSLHTKSPSLSECLVREAKYFSLVHIDVLSRYMSKEEVMRCIESFIDVPASGSYKHDVQLVCDLSLGLFHMAKDYLQHPGDQNESFVKVIFEVLVRVTFSCMDSSFSSVKVLCSLYSLDDEQLASFANDRDWGETSDMSIIKNIKINAVMGSLLILSYRLARPETQQSFCKSSAVFESHPILHTWLSCALMESVDAMIATNLSRNYIMTHGLDDIAHKLSIVLAEGYRDMSERKAPTSNNQALAWMATLIRKQHTNGSIAQGISHAAIICLVGLYVGNVHDRSFALTLESALLVLPKAVEFFRQHNPEMFSPIAETFMQIYNRSTIENDI